MISYIMSLIRHERRTFLFCKETGMQKMGKVACENWQGICGPFCNDDTNERGLRLPEFVGEHIWLLQSIQKMYLA